MPNLKIENSTEPTGLEIKRFRVPIVFTSECPQCGEKVTFDGESDPFEYPEINKAVKIYFGHDNYEEYHGWSETIVLRVTAHAPDEEEKLELGINYHDFHDAEREFLDG